ncbi:MAG TPA: GNAT family N-acetyltransferase [Pyrinomonadaceae bacterium]|nr:GNAT family N-acetyltransferase [Pyrinomonadaceae bacterium]
MKKILATRRVQIRPLFREDWDRVLAIYLEGMATGLATFETAAPTWEKWDSAHHNFARLVAVSNEDGQLAGWAALSPVSSRAVYSGVAEVSVYVGNEFRRQGVGGMLLDTLIEQSESNSIWTLQASIFPENNASIALHVNRGFREIGTRERVAKLNGIWRNTVLLERRSQIVGLG